MAQITMAFLIVLGLSSNLIMLSHASEFLKAPHAILNEHVSEEDIRVSLLDEVEGSLGKGSASNRLSQIEAGLRPIVAALPKNAHGNLEHSAVNYALHRLFVLRHGWVIKGLSNGTEAQNSSSNSSSSSSTTGVLKDKVPDYIVSMFDQRLKGKGYGLRDLAILAATMEHLIHNEAVSNLGLIFNVFELSLTSTITKDEAIEVLDTYMMHYILGELVGNLTKSVARAVTKAMPGIFLAWNDTQKFVEGVRTSIIKDDVDGSSFASLATVVEAVGEQFGTFQDLECQEMKQKLKKMEYHGTGRVMLSDFYKPSLEGEGAWTFTEGSAYLRNLGALDESDPNRPSVMIPNYVYSPSNCIGTSGFYSICCKNDCEGLLGHLEENIGTPEAKAATIVNLVSNLPSRTVTAPQKLSANLLSRLDDIAAHHLGTVPLHGRLFAQWMHHVYPRECPYPHMTGTIDSKHQEDWMKETGSDGTATKEEMKEHIVRAAKFSDSHVQGDLAVEDLTPWSHEEELFVAKSFASEVSTDSISSALRSIALLAVSGSFAYAMIHTFDKTVSLGLGAPLGNEKYMV